MMLTRRSIFALVAALIGACHAQEAEEQLVDLGSLFLVTEQFPFAAAENACVQAGGVLAGFGEKSAGADFSLLVGLKSAGNASFWMKSHETDQYESKCLQFNVGEKSAMAADCSELRPVVCEKRAAKPAKKQPETKVVAGRKPCRVTSNPCGCNDRFNCNICDYKSSSSSSSSSSSEWVCTCEESFCQRNYLADYDFYSNAPRLTGANTDWSYVNEAVALSTAKLTFGCKGGFLDTKVYDVTVGQSEDPYADHFKYFVSANEPVPVPRAGSVVFEYMASSATYRTEQNGFPEVLESPAGEDVRYASGAFQVFSLNDPLAPNPSADGLVFSFYLTNDRVFIGYERRVTLGSTYAAFNFLIPVKVRKPCDLHDMKIAVNHPNRYVSWKLDGREVYRVSKVGYLLSREFMMSDFGGIESDAFPEVLKYGFGSMTLLDNYPACLRSADCRSCKFPDLRQALVQSYNGDALTFFNPVLGPPQAAVFYDTASLARNRLWGQGSTTDIKRLAVYQENCDI